MCPSNDEDKNNMPPIPYKQAVGCLLFTAQITRPEICYAVKQLSRFGSNLDKAHCKGVKRVTRCLKGTIDKGIVYEKQVQMIASQTVKLCINQSGLERLEKELNPHSLQEHGFILR